MWNFLLRMLKRRSASASADLDRIVPRPAVRDELVNAMRNPLVESGFERSDKGRFMRYSKSWIDVVDVQFLKVRGLPGNCPSIHLGRFLSFVPRDSLTGPVPIRGNELYPSAEHCHLRRTVYKGVVQRETEATNVWYVGSDIHYLHVCAEDVKRAAISQILPWFKWLDDLRTVFQLVESGSEDIEGKWPDLVRRGTWGYGGYFGRQVVGGFIALELGEYELAANLLEQVIFDGGVVGRGGRVFPLPETSIEQIKEAVAKAKQNLG